MAMSTPQPRNDGITPSAERVACDAACAELDALALLKAELDTLSQLLNQCECAPSLALMKLRVDEICCAFRVHTQVAEELFYPGVMAASPVRWRLYRSGADPTSARALVQQLENAEPRSASYDIKVTVLSRLIKQHIRHMQVDVLPIARASSLDMVSLGARMAARKSALLHRSEQDPRAPAPTFCIQESS